LNLPYGSQDDCERFAQKTLMPLMPLMPIEGGLIGPPEQRGGQVIS
jgi:hypothetical protein